MSFDGLKGALVAASLGLQIWVASTESYCGLSGQDSLVRAILAPLDSTSGLLLFLGLLHFVDVLKDGSLLKIHRWDLLHPGQPGNNGSTLELPLRTRWRQIDKPTRTAHMMWKSKDDNEFTGLSVALNTSLLIVPYVRARASPNMSQGSSAGRLIKEIPINATLIMKAASRSIAQWFTLISWTCVAFVGQTCLLWFYISTWWQRSIVVAGIFGRLAITWFQLSSVLTYSCQYKGVSTWASPESHRFEGNEWGEQEQETFSQFVWSELRRDYLGKGLFWVSRHLWGPFLSKIVPSDFPASSMFAEFQSPRQGDCDKGGEIRVMVSEKTATTNTPIVELRFTNVPAELKYYMDVPLCPPRLHQLAYGWSIVFFVFCAVFEPIILSFAKPNIAIQICYLVEQIVLNLIRYYDFGSGCINTALEEDTFTVGEMTVSVP